MYQWQHLQESGQHFMQRQQHAQETGQNQCSININSMQYHGQESGQHYMQRQHLLQETGQHYVQGHHQVQEALQHQRNINSMQWAAGVPQVYLYMIQICVNH